MDAQELKGLAEAVQASDKELKSLLAAQAVEIKQHGTTLDGTVNKIAEAEKRYDDAIRELKASAEKIDRENADVMKRVSDLEKAGKRMGWTGDQTGEPESLGQQFVSHLEENGDIRGIKAGRRESSQLTVKSFHDYPGFGRKDNLLLSSATRFAAPYRDAMLPTVQRRLRIRDLMPKVSMTAPSVEYVQTLGFGPAATVSVTSIAVSSTTATATFGSAHGYRVGDWFQISGATGGVAADDAKHNKVFRVGTVSSATVITYTIESGATNGPSGTLVARRMRGGAAAGVAEAGAKPEAAMVVELQTATAQVIAHWLPTSRQVLDDVPGLRAMVDNELLYGLLRKEESALLYGTGTSPELQGIMTNGNAWTYTGVTGDTKLDAIRRAMTFVYLSEMDPSGAVLAPEDWEGVELAKGNDGQYLLVDAGSRVWRIPVVVTTAMDTGDFLVGAFDQGAMLYDREQANVRFSEHHSTYFTYNLLAILAEERVAVAWKRPDAFVVGAFGSAV